MAAAGAAVIAIVVVDVSNEVMDVTSQVPMGTFSQYPYPQVQVWVSCGYGYRWTQIYPWITCDEY